MHVYQQEPFGYEAQAFSAAQIAATIVNCTPRGRGAKVYQATDFYSAPWVETGEGLSQEQRNFLNQRKTKRAKAKNGKRR